MSDKEIEELRAAVRADRRARKGPFSRELRERLQLLLERRWRAGQSLRTLAKQLGLSDHTVQYWRSHWGKRNARAVGLRRVEVIAEHPLLEKRVTVHGPRGTRIEQLSIDEVAELWEKLS